MWFRKNICLDHYMLYIDSIKSVFCSVPFKILVSRKSILKWASWLPEVVQEKERRAVYLHFIVRYFESSDMLSTPLLVPDWRSAGQLIIGWKCWRSNRLHGKSRCLCEDPHKVLFVVSGNRKALCRNKKTVVLNVLSLCQAIQHLEVNEFGGVQWFDICSPHSWLLGCGPSPFCQPWVLLVLVRLKLAKICKGTMKCSKAQ